VGKLFAGLESLDAETVTKDEIEAAARVIAVDYGDYPDSPRCRVDTLKKGIRYR
jgi:hypothetical protein